jgi:TonB family protein
MRGTAIAHLDDRTREICMLSIAAVTSGADNTRTRTVPSSLAVSIGLHACGLTLLLAIAARGGLTPIPQQAPAPPAVHVTPSHVVFLVPTSRLQPGGGGGGGGNRQTGPIRRAESPGRDAITLRIAKPIEPSPRIVDAEPRLPGLLLDAKPLASGFVDQLGLPSGGVTFGTSTGPGTRGGVGSGTGTGIGDGRGPGLGDGVGGGTGGGVYRPGGSVTAPQLVLQLRPSYTASALDRRIQGSVMLELVVTEKGAPSLIRVVRSLDPGGLDDEAIKAVREWKFTPGRMSGTPVPVLVNVVLDFSIR